MQYEEFIKYCNVPRGTFDLLEKYVELLLKWNKSINLIARGQENNIWLRHIIDSCQLAEYIDANSTILDVGSGGGLPAIVLAIIRTDIKIQAIDVDERKCAFMTNVIVTLGLSNIKSLCIDIAKHEGQYSIISSRAFTQIPEFFELTKHIGCDRIIIMKGKNFEQELIDAEKSWQFDYTTYVSQTEKDARVIIASNIMRK